MDKGSGSMSHFNREVKVSDMDREQFIRFVDNGDYCDQDVIDLYDELQETKKKLEDPGK